MFEPLAMVKQIGIIGGVLFLICLAVFGFGIIVAWFYNMKKTRR